MCWKPPVVRAQPVSNNKVQAWGIGWGFITGAVLMLLALLSTPEQISDPNNFGQWIRVNLGHSIWPFTVVIVLFTLKLRRLRTLLAEPQNALLHTQDILALEQMLDVWTQVFIGIGVIWTAIGMRSALQYTLGEPQAVLSDDAGNVLRKLVDGGILLALSTTIVGAVGGYLMRVIKTLYLGPGLQSFHENVERQDISALLAATQRIEQHLNGMAPASPAAGSLHGHKV